MKTPALFPPDEIPTVAPPPPPAWYDARMALEIAHGAITARMSDLRRALKEIENVLGMANRAIAEFEALPKRIMAKTGAGPAQQGRPRKSKSKGKG